MDVEYTLCPLSSYISLKGPFIDLKIAHIFYTDKWIISRDIYLYRVHRGGGDIWYILRAKGLRLTTYFNFVEGRKQHPNMFLICDIVLMNIK